MTINNARKILGSSSKTYSDEDIQYLINQFLGIAEVITQIVGSKKTTTGIESIKEKGDYDIS